MKYFALAVPILLLATSVAAQDTPERDIPGALSVFLDCDPCDDDFVRQEIDFVNYVRDRTLADVHVFVTSNPTGAGDRYTLDYIGRRDMEALRDTLHVVTSNTDTFDERRAALTHALELGLVRYASRTPLADQLNVSFSGADDEIGEVRPSTDPWNSWVFSVGAEGDIESEESTDFLRVGGEIEADRVTADWKIRISMDGNYRRSRFDLEDTLIVSISRDGSLSNFTAKSLDAHWSVGSSTYLNTSSFDNVDLEASIAPAIEYSVFPYSEFNRREFRIQYELGVSALDYHDVTVFDKTAERLLFHELEGILELNQPWGEAEFNLEAFQYLHDFTSTRTSFYRVALRGEMDVRILRGLSAGFGASISWVRDQIALSAEELTEDEILLGSRRLPTDYEYGFSMGLSYTFGSIYNSVVNPRFGF